MTGLPPAVAETIRYSIGGGGKRLRGMLLLAAYDAAGGKDDASGLAAAVEMIHAYSLVHDDLPCMDDDDIRRGRATSHRVFGSGAATIAGAVMIPIAATLANDSARSLKLPASTGCMIVKILMQAGGGGGMIGGQLLDLDAEGSVSTRDELDAVHSAKTGALIAAALSTGGIAAGATPEAIAALGKFGSKIGLAFQIMDDVLDVTSSTDALGKIAGRDATLGKSTYPALLGVDGASSRARTLVLEGCAELKSQALLTPALEQLAGFVVSRNH